MPPDTGPSMHAANSGKSADRESFIPPEENEMLEVNLEDPWVRRQDFDYKRRGRGYGKRQGNIINIIF